MSKTKDKLKLLKSWAGTKLASTKADRERLGDAAAPRA